MENFQFAIDKSDCVARFSLPPPPSLLTYFRSNFFPFIYLFWQHFNFEQYSVHWHRAIETRSRHACDRSVDGGRLCVYCSIFDSATNFHIIFSARNEWLRNIHFTAREKKRHTPTPTHTWCDDTSCENMFNGNLSSDNLNWEPLTLHALRLHRFTKPWKYHSGRILKNGLRYFCKTTVTHTLTVAR